MFEALQAIASKESCKEAVGQHKRPRQDDDPDSDPKSKKSRKSDKPSSSHQPRKTSKAPPSSQRPPASGSAPKQSEEPFELQQLDTQEGNKTTIPESEIPSFQAGPSDTTKTKEN
ncbi:hypothetical protein CTI12_AA577430 [Artemisia annua]|uniref:Uncharacterized protein n=1 Tax=Artemisia annua TaxID=35608 RepID=A0A2U1KQI8_ARTAN|nr:hypothetical protein CTI12_AA577430 [Artemisia annua]